MAYEPTTWEAGMKVTASRLNKIEQGVANACDSLFVFVTETDTQTGTMLDITYNEILTAVQQGKMIKMLKDINTIDGSTTATAHCIYDMEEYVTGNADGSTYYNVVFRNNVATNDGTLYYTAQNPDDYFIND